MAFILNLNLRFASEFLLDFISEDCFRCCSLNISQGLLLLLLDFPCVFQPFFVVVPRFPAVNVLKFLLEIFQDFFPVVFQESCLGISLCVSVGISLNNSLELSIIMIFQQIFAEPLLDSLQNSLKEIPVEMLEAVQVESREEL